MLPLILIFGVLAKVLSTPLDDYVWTTDPAYTWSEIEGTRYVGKGFKVYTLNMTSQTWLTPEDFSPGSGGHVWWHYISVVVPDELDYTNNATLWITGGDYNSGIPTPLDSFDLKIAITFALHSRSITASLFQIPNQHITFTTDPIQKSRSEDALIAFTWDHFIKDPSQPNWLVRFPMVKASVRAMDAVKDFCASSLPELNTKLDYFTISGASKRGWTTWLVGAVDPARAVAIVPVVLDAINFIPFCHHQFKSYGGWAYALKDYTDMDIMTRLDDPNMQILAEYEDPYYYKERLTMPKLVVNAAMDEFQQPDDTSFWWSEMPEPKHFIMVPNAEHSMSTGILEVVPAAGEWIKQVLANTVIPSFTWTIDSTTGAIDVVLDRHGEVEQAAVHWAYSCGTNNVDNVKRRDFRISSLDNPCGCGPYAEGTCANLKSFYNTEILNVTYVNGHRTYHTVRDAPTDGRWVAYFIDVKYRNTPTLPAKTSGTRKETNFDNVSELRGFIPTDFARRLEFTSEVSIFPTAYAYADCTGESCGSTLV